MGVSYLSPSDALRELLGRPEGDNPGRDVLHVAEVREAQDLRVFVVHQSFVGDDVCLRHVHVGELVRVQMLWNKSGNSLSVQWDTKAMDPSIRYTWRQEL